MLIRKLTPSDSQPYLELRMEGLAKFPQAFDESVEELQIEGREGMAKRIATRSDERAFILGAFAESGQLSGAVGLQGLPREKMNHTALLWGFYVAEEAQGKGVGRRLMARLVKEASSWSGLVQIKLSVGAQNTIARSFYESLGFVTFGVEPRVLQIGGEFFDENHMMLSLV